MQTPDPIDFGEFDSDNTDRSKIEHGTAVPCRICESVFRRVRLTWRYCAECNMAFCEGEHGTFARGGRGTCVQCGPHAA
jgi:hypothetical protein